jgi:hypothetical protein
MKTSGNTVTTLAGVAGIKENDTDGSGGDVGALAFGTRATGDYVKERMRIASDGSVGIGANAPGTVNGTDRKGGGGAGLLHLQGAVPRLIFDDNGDTPQFAITCQDFFAIDKIPDDSSSEAQLLKVQSDGICVHPSHVIIAGAIIPGSTSEVDNQKIFDSSSGSGTNALFIGNAQIQVSSDKRLKINIRDTEMNL